MTVSLALTNVLLSVVLFNVPIEELQYGHYHIVAGWVGGVVVRILAFHAGGQGSIPISANPRKVR